MTATVKRLSLGLGAGLIALTSLAGGFVHAQGQDPNAQQHQGPGRPRRARRTGRIRWPGDRWASCRGSAVTSA